MILFFALRQLNMCRKKSYYLLNLGGTLVLSTPFGQGRGKPCGSPFHIHQYTIEEFIDLFQAFSDIEVYYQRGVTIEPPRKDVYYPIGVAVCNR